MHSIAWWPTCILAGVATVTDLRSRRIPNWLVLPFMLAGVLASSWFRSWHGLEQSLLGMALALGVYGFFFWMGGMGAGDVKLGAAIGAWIGPHQLLIALVLASIAGGAMAVVWAAWGGFLKDMFQGTGNLAFGWKQRGTLRDPELDLANPRRRKLPYAPAIAIGTLMSFLAR